MTSIVTAAVGVAPPPDDQLWTARLATRLLRFRRDADKRSSCTPLGHVVLVCGPGCSTDLIADHLGAALAGGNTIVVTFFEDPSPSTALLLDAVAVIFSTGDVERLTTGGSWNLDLPDVYVLAVLTPLHFSVGDDLHSHGTTRPGRGSTAPLIDLYTTTHHLLKEATS